MIDPRLQTLRVLHEQGTITAAAGALHLTPSTVSQQLRALAREVGIELLEADGRNVRLTPAALSLLEHANELFAQWERARADLAAYRDGTAGDLVFTSISSALGSVVAPAAARVRRANPRLRIHISEEESQATFPLLLAGRSDIAVLIPTAQSPPPDDARFDQQPLLDEPMDLLAPLDHPLARHESVHLAEAAHESWIASPDRVDQYQLLLSSCAAAGFTPHITQSGKDWIAISGLVANGFGVCLIPRLAHVPPEHEVTRIPLQGEPRPRRRLITCIRRGSDEQPAIALGLVAVRDAARAIDTSSPAGNRGTPDPS